MYPRRAQVHDDQSSYDYTSQNEEPWRYIPTHAYPPPSPNPHLTYNHSPYPFNHPPPLYHLENMHATYSYTPQYSFHSNDTPPHSPTSWQTQETNYFDLYPQPQWEESFSIITQPPDENEIAQVERRLQIFILEAKDDMANLRATLKKEIEDELAAFKEETLQPLKRMEDTIAWLVSEVTKKNQMEAQAVTLRGGKTLPESSLKQDNAKKGECSSHPNDIPKLNEKGKEVDDKEEEASYKKHPSTKGKEIAQDQSITRNPKVPFP